jgi:uncharacterized protein YcfL
MKYLFATFFTLVFLLGGCSTPHVALQTKPNLPYQALDASVNASIEKISLSNRLLADGRIEVLCVLKNRTTAPVSITVNCVFEDTLGNAINEPSISQSTTIFDSVPLTLRFESKSKDAKRYSIMVKSNS